jgi:hypothetical protein
MKYTETTAKKGMTQYKNGYGKNDKDWGFLHEINYDDKRALKEVIETLFGKLEKSEKAVEDLKSQFKERVDQLELEYNKRLERIEKAFEQNIKEWLSI